MLPLKVNKNYMLLGIEKVNLRNMENIFTQFLRTQIVCFSLFS